MQPQQLQQINVLDLMNKFRSKREIYNFIAMDGQVYLPRYDSTNIYFLKQIMQGKKQVSLFPS
jgi:hypothetical protein